MPNRLAREASPYLKQHAENPVDWFPWGQEALARARREDKPILLSIGYSACHWCHVMERECFEDAAIAKLMNEHFVSIKVDREERPDLDQIYQLTAQLLGRSGGWPLTVFLTPDQRPFFAGTYFPPVDRHGLPSFPRILEAVADAYANKRGDIDLQAKEISDAITQVSAPDARDGEVPPDVLARAATKLQTRFDDEHGGFGSRPKFPSTMSLDVLLMHAIANQDEKARARCKRALDAMRDGGIWDQLGGGFHRYSTDERWLVPHFEKMLYDNALLLRLYVDGYRVWREERYASTAREIVGYLEREMLDASGGFYATQDADSEGEEGKFFVWTQAEIRDVLGEDAALACARFGVEPEGNFEDTDASVLSIARSIEELAVKFTVAPSEIERRLERARATLLAHRDERVKPFRDEKILAAWNGLLVSSLADASRALSEPRWLELAERAFAYVWTHLRKGDRIVRHASQTSGFLDDQAFVACAALDLHETTGNPAYLEHARLLAKTIRDAFRDESGALYLAPKDGEALIARTQDVYDHALPSAT
ncbi:MAG TPA: thioredoxin domain-containing protein, partial [Polyangiaceae bacterium]|nr:thioredoxin domain-containing protein [Polyangiaceae bacterium]